MAKLKQDVLFWLRESEQQVKVALTIQVTRRGSITIQQWILDQQARRSTLLETDLPIQTSTRSRAQCISNSKTVSFVQGGQRVRFRSVE
jgi:hypothetical protein